MGKSGHNQKTFLRAAPAKRSRGLKIGLFGGSFNPVHGGHLQIADHAQKSLGLDDVWWLVTPGNPLKVGKFLASFEQRCQSVQKLIGHRRMHVSAIERDLGTKYSIDIVRQLNERLKAVQFFWIVGADSLCQLHLWKDWQDLAHILPVVVVDRPGFTLKLSGSVFGQRFRQRRVGVGTLKNRAVKTPKWIVLYGKKNPVSSTQLRKNAKK